MKFSHHWLVERRVVYYELSGKISIDDLDTINRIILENLAKADGKQLVHNLIDVTGIEELPALHHIVTRSQFLRHPNYGWAVFWKFNNPALNMIAYWVYMATKVRFRTVNNLEEGLLLLQDIDLRLPDLKAAWAKVQAQVTA